MIKEMKDSGIEWVGQIPKEWNIAKLKYEVSISSGTAISKNEYVDDGFDIIGANGVIGKTNRTNNKKTILTTGRVGTIGTVNKVKDCWVSDNALIIDVDSRNDIDYLSFTLMSLDYSQLTSGTAMPLITASKLLQQSIPFISKTLQKTISVFLSNKCSQIDSLLSKIQEQIDTLEQYKKSVITEAVTKGLNLDVEMKDSGVDWIGMIPKHWQRRRFKYVHDGSNVGESIDKQFWSILDTDTPFYTAGILPIHSTYKNFPIWKYVSKNDLLLSRNGTPYVYYPLENSMYSDHVIRIKIKDSYDKRFIRYILQRSIEKTTVETVSIATWSVSLWNEQQLVIPDIKEQKEISNYLDKKCSQIDSIISDKKEQLETLEQYKKSLIYEYVTGKKEVA